MKKNITFFIIIVGIFLAILSAVYLENKTTNDFYNNISANTVEQKATPTQDRFAWVMLDFGNGKKREFKGQVDDSTYPLLTAMQSVANAGNFKYKVADGKFVEIAGVGGEAGKWKIYLNGNETTKAVNNLTITSGDKYILTYNP